MGSKSHSLEINELSETRVNGKKATRLCPCGHAGDSRQACSCSPDRLRNYVAKLSGPLLDRLDLLIEVPALPPAELLEPEKQQIDWELIRKRVADCRQMQLQRNGKLNSDLGVEELLAACPLPSQQRSKLAQTMEKLGMSARTTHRIIKVARTIADYEQREGISSADLYEAISYRRCPLLQARAH